MAQKTLSVKLSLNDKQFQSSLRKATRRMKKFGTSMKKTGESLSRNLTLPLVAFGAASIAAFDKQQKAIAQVETTKSNSTSRGWFKKYWRGSRFYFQAATTDGCRLTKKNIIWR